MLRWSWPPRCVCVFRVRRGARHRGIRLPVESVELMKAPKGFRVELVASEPDLIKPIAMTTDAHGRVWVVESHSYPHWLTDGKKPGKDRVLIYEPTADGWKGKVFLEGGVNLSGIAVGHGGVWITSVPRLLFSPPNSASTSLRAPPDSPRRLEPQDQAQRRQQPHLGAGRLALRTQRHPVGIARVAPGTPNEKRTKLDCGVLALPP